MEDSVEYKLIRSSRKTIGIEVSPDGVTVRAPYRVPVYEIDEFILSKRAWIRKNIEKDNIQKLARAEIDELADRALKVIPERVKYCAPLVGVTYGRITIRKQRSRWGSCSAKGNLNFNCLLMLAPEGVVDAVVVHELCHRLEMNHSERFYENVFRVFPEYRKYDLWLKKFGSRLMRRMTG